MNDRALLIILFGLFSLSFLMAYGVAAQSCAPIPSGLVNWWPADGTPDDIRRYDDASLHGGVVYAPGRVGQAFSLDGVNGWLTLPSWRHVVGQSFVSIACWIRPHAATPGGVIYTELKGGGTVFGISRTSDGRIYLVMRTDVSAEAATPTVFTSIDSTTANNWHLVVATVDVMAKSYHIYIDGAPVAITGVDHTTQQSFVTAADSSFIGVWRWGTSADSWFSGEIDELQIYYCVLSISDVASIYAAGASGVCRPPWNPEIPGYVVDTYAYVVDPERMTFAPNGDMYVGRDNSGSGGGNMDAVPIHRVRAGGVVEEYGPAIADPDAVLFDGEGRVSQPGAVLVAGNLPGYNPPMGGIHAILPDRTTVMALGPSDLFPNSNDIIFDRQGRLLILDEMTCRILVYTNGQLSILCNLPLRYPETIAVDGQNRIYTSTLWADESHATIRVHDAAGVPINANLLSGIGYYPLVGGAGGTTWGTDIYTIDEDGALVRITADGDTTHIGTGFPVKMASLAFGPDSLLYISDFRHNRILRVIPVTETSVPDGRGASTAGTWLRAVPNPFNPCTVIQYEVPREGPVSIRIYDVRGRTVRRLVEGARKIAGRYEVRWDGHSDENRELPSGIYFCQLQTAGGSKTKKLVLLK